LVTHLHLLRNLIYDVEGGNLCGKTTEAYQYRLDADFTGTHKLSCDLRVPVHYTNGIVMNKRSIYSRTALNLSIRGGAVVEALRY
jgi:hypothetical protein